MHILGHDYIDWKNWGKSCMRKKAFFKLLLKKYMYLGRTEIFCWRKIPCFTWKIMKWKCCDELLYKKIIHQNQHVAFSKLNTVGSSICWFYININILSLRLTGHCFSHEWNEAIIREKLLCFEMHSILQCNIPRCLLFYGNKHWDFIAAD